MHNSKLQTVEEVDFELEQNNEYQLEPLELILEKMMDAEPEPEFLGFGLGERGILREGVGDRAGRGGKIFLAHEAHRMAEPGRPDRGLGVLRFPEVVGELCEPLCGLGILSLRVEFFGGGEAFGGGQCRAWGFGGQGDC